MATVLFIFGYPVSIAVITRWTAVVREQRSRWAAIHHAGVIAIILGWIIKGNAGAVAVNSLWLLSSTLWYVWGGRKGSDAS